MYTAKDEKGKQIALKLLQELAKSYKVYFVNGEHDCDEKFIQNLKDNEVNVLDYKKEAIAIKNTKINLYGITNQYYSATFDLKNCKLILKKYLFVQDLRHKVKERGRQMNRRPLF